MVGTLPHASQNVRLDGKVPMGYVFHIFIGPFGNERKVRKRVWMVRTSVGSGWRGVEDSS